MARIGLSVRAFVLAAIVVLAAPPGWGAAAVVLKDGQVLEGTDVRRQGEEVLLTLDGGNVITLPDSIVKEIRLSGDGSAGKTPPPTAFRTEGPETLAGNEVVPPRKSDQLANAGTTSRFQEDVVDPNWTPPGTDWDMDTSNNDFAPSTWSRSPVDPDWEPDSAFDAREDVLAAGKSNWQKSIVDPTWKPEDGFRRSGVSYAPPPRGGGLFWSGWASPQARGTSRASAATRVAVAEESPPRAAVIPPPPPTPADDPSLCADRLPLPSEASGDAAAVRVSRLYEERYDPLPFPLWEAYAGSGDSARRVVFTVVANECRVLGGDLAPVSDAPLSRGLEVSRGVVEFDAALAGSAAPRLASAQDKIALAFAAVGVTDPEVSGADRAEIRLIERESDLTMLDQGTSSCSESSRKRKKALQRAIGRFAIPSVDQGPGGTVVRFQAWTSGGGRVSAYEVYVGGDGRVAIKREETASHVGGHVDPRATVETARR
jgi:hypothetical protein